MKEDETSGKKRKTFSAAISDVAPPSSIHSVSKRIPLKNEPCFYSIVSDTLQNPIQTFNAEQVPNTHSAASNEVHENIDAASDSE